MKDYSLYNFYKEISVARVAEHLDLIEYVIQEDVYRSGDHLKPRNPTKLKFFSNILLTFAAQVFAQFTVKRPRTVKYRGFSLSSSTYDCHFLDGEYSIDRAVWAPKRDVPSRFKLRLWVSYLRIRWCFNFSPRRFLIDEKFIDMVSQLKKQLIELVEKEQYSFLFVSDDLSFEARLLISVFDELGMPSFLLAHGGMHSFYGNGMDERTTYLCQWGQLQVDGFVENGYDVTRLFNVGHPSYIKKKGPLRSSLDSVLVLTRSCTAARIEEVKEIEDRGKAVAYMLELQSSLQSLGVERVRYRPHPVEESDWYSQFLDPEFFKLDNDSVGVSLNKSSLVVGPISTMMVDAVCRGVNYVIFEPLEDAKNILGATTISPMLSRPADYPWAKSREELESTLKQGRKISKDGVDALLNDRFEADLVKEKIELHS